MLKTFSSRSPKAVASTFLATGLFAVALAVPNPITGTPEAKAAGEPTFGTTFQPYVPVDGKSVKLQRSNNQSFDLSDNAPDPARFTVMVGTSPNAVANPVTSVAVESGWILKMNVTNGITKGAVVTVSYSAAGDTPNKIKTISNVAALDFGPLTATNNISTFVQTVPNAPGVSTVLAGEENATITVTPPNSGPAPTSYEVTSSPDGKTCTVDGPSGSCTITGLTAGVAYTFTTVAKTASGSSPAGLASASTTVLAKTAPNTPGVPTVAAGEESATITVTAPTSGLTPTSYEVTATPGGKTCTVAGASGSCTISGLTAGTAYTFTTIAKVSTGNSTASTASASTTVLAKTTITTTATTVPASTATTIPLTTIPAGYTPSWDKEPLTDSETDANTVGYFPAVSPGVIIITDEMGFTLDKKNGIKPKIRMKNYAGKIKMSISASYKVGAKTKKYKCTFAPFGTAKKIKTSKWRWYTPKKACILPAPLVAAVRANTATLSASGKWSRQWLTTSKKARPDKTKIKARTLKYTMKAKPAAVK